MIDKKLLQTPKGTRDFSGSIARKRQQLIRFFEDNFEKFDFEPLITPNIEYKELVDSKSNDTYGDQLKLMYSFKDLKGRNLILKFDQTIPLVRFVASNPALPLPYKRYAIGRAYRFENVQKGRYREFWQCDLDIIGSNNSKADSFIMNVVINISKKLGFVNSKIIFNNRKIIFEILEKIGVDVQNNINIIRILDKLDKIGLERVKNEIAELIGNDLTIKLIAILNIDSKDNISKLNSLKIYLSESTYLETKNIFLDLEELGVSKDVEFNLFLARGLDYYTSTIFELIDKDTDIGSLGGGGRYDDMIEQFCGRQVPAIGFAFGFERIYDILDRRNLLKISENKNNVFLISPNKESRFILKLNKKLLDNSINSSYDFGNKNISKQIQYAIKNNFRYVIICELKELNNNQYKFKDLINNTEKIMTFEEIVRILNKKLI